MVKWFNRSCQCRYHVIFLIANTGSPKLSRVCIWMTFLFYVQNIQIHNCAALRWPAGVKWVEIYLHIRHKHKRHSRVESITGMNIARICHSYIYSYHGRRAKHFELINWFPDNEPSIFQRVRSARACGFWSGVGAEWWSGGGGVKVPLFIIQMRGGASGNERYMWCVGRASSFSTCVRAQYIFIGLVRVLHNLYLSGCYLTAPSRKARAASKRITAAKNLRPRTRAHLSRANFACTRRPLRQHLRCRGRPRRHTHTGIRANNHPLPFAKVALHFGAVFVCVRCVKLLLCVRACAWDLLCECVRPMCFHARAWRNVQACWPPQDPGLLQS